jgi:hypothetical protein
MCRKLFAGSPLVVFVVALLLISCGGGGGGGGSTGVTGSDTGSTSGVGPLGCSLSLFSPNYLQVDDPSSGNPNQVHWWDHFPIRVYFTSTPTLQGQSLAAVSLAGFNAWSEVAGKTVAIQVFSESQADLVVSFENLGGPPGDGDWVGQTSWSFSPSTKETFESEMTLRTWNGMTANQVANGLRGTAQHEFGHAIFLDGHSNNSQDSMYPFGSITTYTPLTTRDENSLATSYCGSFDNRAPSLVKGPVITKTIQCPAP